MANDESIGYDHFLGRYRIGACPQLMKLLPDAFLFGPRDADLAGDLIDQQTAGDQRILC